MIRSFFLPCVVIVAFCGLAFAFALSQSIWVDETTQLSGLTLGFRTQLDWLMGGTNPIPGVPPDRTPPLSYWMGLLWARVFGLGELSLRAFGIFAMLCGAPAVYLSAREMGKTRGDPLFPAIVLAIVYLAPGTIIQAGEIRAYPLYFAFSAWATFAYLCALARPDRHIWLILLGLFCLAAGYTHFFGTVMAGFLWLSLLGLRLARRQPASPVLLGGVATAVLFAGLLPFVSAAMELSVISNPQQPGLFQVMKASVRTITRLWLHGVHLSSPLIVVSAFSGMAVLVLLSLYNTVSTRFVYGIGLLLPMTLGLVGLPLLKLTVGGFDVLAPHYNLWLVPLFSLFSATALLNHKLRTLPLVSAGVLIAAHLAADYQLIRYAKTYSHGPGEWIASQIDDPDTTVVIHDATMDWGHTYFPVYYLTSGRVTQILRESDSPDRLVSPKGFSEYRGSTGDFLTRIYVRTRKLDSGELARSLKEPGNCGILPMSPETQGKIKIQSYCAFVSATVAISQKTE